MSRFLITRLDKKCKLNKKIKFEEGYSFSQKLKIEVYNRDIIGFILRKKVNNQIDKLMKMLFIIEAEDDDESSLNLLAKVETLKLLLWDKYSLYLSKEEIELLLYKLENIENKINIKKNIGRRH